METDLNSLKITTEFNRDLNNNISRKFKDKDLLTAIIIVIILFNNLNIKIRLKGLTIMLNKIKEINNMELVI